MRTLGILLLVLGAAGCSGDPGPTATSAPPVTVAPPGLDEVAPGFDESPDGEPPVPDEELAAAALTEILRTEASVAPAGHCTADQLEVALVGFDAALGSRYSSIVVTNTSDKVCVVEGAPGIGVRGEWGSAFVPEIRPSDRRTNGDRIGAAPIRLAPGERAVSDLEWRGDLAGAESESASLLVVQMARGQVPATVPARLDGAPATPRALDIGQFTTISVTPFYAVP